MKTKYICLRDDDTNYFTKYKDLKEGYGEIWGKYPITLATIPFVHGSESKILDYDKDVNKFQKLDIWKKNANAEMLTHYHMTYPIGMNKDLVDQLKIMIESGMIEIAQHGVHHRYNIYGAEMKHDNVALNSIVDGKEYLEKTFQVEINVMVPPSNTIDNIVTKKIRELELNLLCSAPIQFDTKINKILWYLKNPKDTFDGFVNKLNGGSPIRKRQGVVISDSLTFDVCKNDDYIYNSVLDKLDRYGFYSITTHYRLLSDEIYRNRYIAVVKRIAMNKEIEFVTASDYFEKAIKNFYCR